CWGNPVRNRCGLNGSKEAASTWQPCWRGAARSAEPAQNEQRLGAVTEEHLQLERDERPERGDELEQFGSPPHMEMNAVVDVDQMLCFVGDDLLVGSLVDQARPLLEVSALGPLRPFAMVAKQVLQRGTRPVDVEAIPFVGHRHVEDAAEAQHAEMV